MHDYGKEGEVAAAFREKLLDRWQLMGSERLWYAQLNAFADVVSLGPDWARDSCRRLVITGYPFLLFHQFNQEDMLENHPPD